MNSFSEIFKTITAKTIASLLVVGTLLVIYIASTAETSGISHNQIGKVGLDTSNVNLILDNMTLEEKVGQLFFIRAYGEYLSDDSHDYKKLEHLIEDEHVGGVTFFKGNVYGQAELTNKLQHMSRIPLWISEDMEYGPAMRISRSTRFTPNMGVAATGDPHNAYQMGRITAVEAKALGVDQIFAPDVDVNNNPDNPIINVRSFSEDPHTVAVFGDAFMEGVMDEGVIPTAKHFPGHGDTDVDSHVSLPISPYGYARLDTLELVPFKYLINKGLPSIMTAHIAFPKISGDSTLPGTLDPDILKKILRDTLNFKGLVVTDALEMQGIASHYSPGEAAIMALKAGADIMLLSPDDYTAIHSVVRAVKDGTLSEQRLDQSVRKLLILKIEKGLFENPYVNIQTLDQKIHTLDHTLISQKISRESTTLLKNRYKLLPIDPNRFPHITAIAMSDDQSGYTGMALGTDLKEYHPDVDFHIYDKRTSDEELDQIIQDASNSNLIILGSFVYVQTATKIQLTQDQLNFVQRLKHLGKPIILIAFGNPYVIRDIPDVDVQICAWSPSSKQVDQTVPGLFGAADINGRLPISIPPYYKRGDGIHVPKTILRPDYPELAGMSSDSLYRVSQIMNAAIEDSAFPGGVVTVIKDGIEVYQKAFGYQTYKKVVPDETNDVFDMASLTKVIATTSSIMKLYQQKKIRLTDHVSKYFPEYRKGEKRRVTLKMLLTHTSGLPPDNTVTKENEKSPEAFFHDVITTPLMNRPGKKYVYSDLNFIILGKIVEKVSGMPLDEYANQNIFTPMDMRDTMFNPLKKEPWLVSRIPPTEIDTMYNRGLLKGVVNDERAYFMGGVAGHAGLYSSGNDLAAYAQMLLNHGKYNGIQLFKPKTVELFTTKESNVSGRGYGFDIKSPQGFSTAGQLMSDKTFGHLGFTGTSMWIDPTRDLAVIILTNREYPHRVNSIKINHVRSAVADAVVSSIIEKN